MFDIVDHIPPDGISPEEFERLQEHIAVIQDQGRYLVEEYLSWWTSTGDKSYECASTDIEKRSAMTLLQEKRIAYGTFA